MNWPWTWPFSAQGCWIKAISCQTRNITGESLCHRYNYHKVFKHSVYVYNNDTNGRIFTKQLFLWMLFLARTWTGCILCNQVWLFTGIICNLERNGRWFYADYTEEGECRTLLPSPHCLNHISFVRHYLTTLFKFAKFLLWALVF